MSGVAKDAADVAALYPMDSPLARIGRERLAELAQEETMTVQIGTPLRDAAVDPRPSDFLAPTNAGKPGPAGNPHGPNVVSPEIGTAERALRTHGRQER